MTNSKTINNTNTGKASFFGLFYSHSFKKAILIIFSYMLITLLTTYFIFSSGYLDEVIININQLDNSFFKHFTIVAFIFLFFTLTHNSSKIFHNDIFVNRLNVKDKTMKITAFIYYFIVMIMFWLSVIITFYLMTRLYFGYFEYGYYDKPFIFKAIIFNDFINGYIPFYAIKHFLWKLGVLILSEIIILNVQKSAKAPIFVDVFMTLFVSFLFNL